MNTEPADEIFLRDAAESLAGLGTWVATIGPSARIVWSSGCYRLFGITPGTPLDLESVLLVVHPADRERVRDARRASMEDGAPYDIRYRIVRGGGETRWIHGKGQTVRSTSPPRFAGVCRDVTEQVEGERALRASEEQLRHSQKMEAVGRLAGGVSHDFNNLLSVILSYCHLTLDTMPAGEPLRPDIEEMLEAAQRAATLTRQLLAFSRKQVLHPTSLTLEGVVSGMAKMLRSLLREDIALSIESCDEPWSVEADRGQLEQVIMNLAVNARDAMPCGGTLSMTVSNVEIASARSSTHDDLPAGSYAMLSVEDTGTGMDEATRARVFEPFFTTKELGKGTGLGLSTVFGIVRQSGGAIVVQSEPGAGTTFRIFFPRSGKAATSVSRPAVEDSSFRGKETVLVVEDDDQLRAIARAILHRYGYAVIDVANAGEALLVCEQYPRPIDLMLTDVIMPRTNGRQLVERVAPIRPDMKVIYMTGYTDDVVLRQGFIEGSLDYLAKPFTPKQLGAKIRAALDGKSRGGRAA
jgi:PAS domain S-box-containing protein